MRLAGKTAIVTGAASGFGAGIARLFAAEGARVAIADLNGPGARQLAAELGGQALPYALDVSDGTQFQALVRHVLDQFGGLDIVVNALCPVAGDTPLLKEFMGEDTPENRARFLATIPLGRFSTPLDIARAALFLVSEEAGLLTGVALEVDGGRCI